MKDMGITKYWRYYLLPVSCLLICLSMLLASDSYVLAQPTYASDIAPTLSTQFFGTTSLDKLSSGAEGEGTLLYYSTPGDPQRPALVVHLAKKPGADVATAEVFDAPAGKTFVPMKIEGEQVTLDSSLRPTISLQALGGWWVKHGITNYNLEIQVNGPVYSMWGGGVSADYGGATWNNLIKPGDPAATIQVRDPAGVGVPMWELRQMVPAFPGRAYYRTNYSERTCGTPLTVDLGVSPLWPYVASSGGFEQDNGTFRPPIVVDWLHGKVIDFSELVTVRHQNCSYSLYSISKVQPGKLNQPDFETPFAFYDLSGQGVGYPNLIVRTERYPLGDPWSTSTDPAFPGKPRPEDFETIRYSWRDRIGDQKWDYKVEVAGFRPYSYTTSIAGGLLAIDAPPYSEFPKWVIGQNWPAVTFIDPENTQYVSSEGIYDWSPRSVGEGYLLGWTSQPDLQAYSEIAQGLRGEYRFKQDSQPKLYFSPVDNQLHLLGAEGGLWNLEGTGVLYPHNPNQIATPTAAPVVTATSQLVIKEENLDGGQNINAWIRERIPVTPAASSASGQPRPAATAVTAPEPTAIVEEALYAMPGYLLYSGSTGAELLHTQYQASSFTTLPPTDNASWQAFRSVMAPYITARRDPGNLKGWLTAFPGQAAEMPGGQISDVSLTGNEFHFVLVLQEVLSASGSSLLGIGQLSPGSYLITYDGTFKAQPTTPALVEVRKVSVQKGGGVAPMFEQLVTLELVNTSTGIASSVPVTVSVQSPTGHTDVLTTTLVSMDAASTVDVTVNWVPLSTGQWKVSATGADLQTRSIDVDVEPVAQSLSDGGIGWPTAVLPLVGLCLLALLMMVGNVVYRPAAKARAMEAPRARERVDSDDGHAKAEMNGSAQGNLGARD